MPSLTIGHPREHQELNPDVAFVVSGTAVGTGGAEPHPIDSVTVQLDGDPPIDASLASSAHPPPAAPAMAYSAVVTLPQAGEHRITVTATDDLGRSAIETVVVATPAGSFCAAGVEWVNYPRTQSLTPLQTCTPVSLDGVAAAVREAEAAGRRAHAFGSRWAFSDCAFTPDHVIETRQLSRPLQKVQDALLSGQSPLVYHVEAGITVRGLYSELDRLRLALLTMGGASGQTLAGAISTGTHGGDKTAAPLADSVLALHLVGAGGTQYWIEPTARITDPARLHALVVPGVDPQNIIYDDETFDACLVGMGCFGVIYAVVLRVREAYDLVETTVESTWRAFRDGAAPFLTDSANRFLQVLVSPYPDPRGENVALVTTRSEAEAGVPLIRPPGNVGGALVDLFLDISPLAWPTLLLHELFADPTATQEERIADLVQTILTATPDQREVLVRHHSDLMRAAWPARTLQGASYSIMDLGYGQPPPASQPGYSVELFFEATRADGSLGFAEFVNAALATVHAATDTFFTGYFSLRFTGATRAFLGPQQWRQTCAVEISVLQGIQGELELRSRLYHLGLDHGALPHWGQLLDLGAQGHGSVYPGYDRWRKVYARLSGGFTARTFANDLSARWNLTTPNDARFVSQSVPAQLEAGRSQLVSVTMRNTGFSTWSAASAYRLGSQAPEDNTRWGVGRVDLPADTSPGATATFQFTVVAPATPGLQSFQWRMVQDGVEWFGIRSPEVAIEVTPPPGRAVVPDVTELKASVAAGQIRDVRLVPEFVGPSGADAWVATQSPVGGTVVALASTVRLRTSTGPQP
jgi:FAD/FMN-containing dehydrogenase